jgi:DNA repair protein RadC
MKSINQLNNMDKPREKLLKKDVKLSYKIIKIFEGNLSSLDLEKVSKIHGLGSAKAFQFIASIELPKCYLIKQKMDLSVYGMRECYDG